MTHSDLFDSHVFVSIRSCPSIAAPYEVIDGCKAVTVYDNLISSMIQDGVNPFSDNAWEIRFRPVVCEGEDFYLKISSVFYRGRWLTPVSFVRAVSIDRADKLGQCLYRNL